MGAKKSDRVLLISENSAFWVAAYLGMMRAGLVCVPLAASISPTDFDHVLRITEASIVFAQAGAAMTHGARLAAVHLVTDREIPGIPGVLSQRSLSAAYKTATGTDRVIPTTEPDDLAALMFTSGSTGRPRGVMVSHRNIMANTGSIIEYLELKETDRILAVLPFYYCFGTSLLHTHLRVGGSLEVDPRFMYPATVVQRMIETECTGFAGVPSHFQILLRAQILRGKNFPHLRYVQQAGGHLAPHFVRELRQVLPTTRIFLMYGQTEATARLSYLDPALLDSKPGSIGKAIPGVCLRVVDDQGRELRAGETGELVAEGDNVALGYWREPGESARSFRNGRLYTGDLARVDGDGFLSIVDRARDILKCGGKRVSCRQIEDQLLECEDLIEAAVIGIPDDALGEAVKAYVVAKTPAHNGLKERIHLFCKKSMPLQWLPKEVVVLPALPKNSAGKVLKAQLRTDTTLSSATQRNDRQTDSVSA